MSKMTIDNTIEMEEWVWIIEMDVVNIMHLLYILEVDY